MSEKALPKFAELPGASLPVQPPFPFEGMSARVFPLRASLDTLQRFVDNYLNIVPPEVGRFRVAVPYVYLCLLDYGKMAIEVNNYGWLAQREILFNVAVEWYRVVDGRWQFYDWASVAPFIYVDDDMSMTVGRSVYGWPKTIASVAPVASDWIKDTQAPVNVATIKTMVFEDLYAGEKMQLQPLLEVDREAPLSALRVPMDALSRLTPWSIVSNVAHASSVLTRDAFKLLPGLGLLPMNEASRPENYIAMMAKLSSMGFPLRPNVSANTLNLKQFRMSEEPRRYCYQALTNGPMRFTALHGAGVLGEQNLLLGDLSGGHTIRLHQWPTLPIAQTLGLEVQSTVRGPGRDVALLKPVAPFWYKANVVYEPGTTLAWRDERGGTWHDTEGKELETSGAVAESEKSFNTALGASNRTIAGPFRFSETTVRVLPLLAYRDKLEKFVDDFLNEALGGGPGQDGERLRLWAAADDDARRTAGGEDVDSERGAAPRFAYVYLVVTSIGDVTSGTDNIGDWADYELSLCVPVLREYWKAGEPEPELRGAGLVQAFTFVDNPTATAAASEVLGIPTSNARFTLPEEQWMSYGGPSTTVKQPLLKVEAQVLPVIGGGEKAERRTILSIYDGEPPEVDDDAWRAVADRWGSALKRELERKKRARAKSKKMFDNARSMALDLLSARAPFSVYTIKQFRDVAEPDRACYQSFVRIHRTAREVMDLREIERPIHVRINEYPTQPLVENLGLVAEPVESDSGGVVYTLQPIRPFWLSGTIEEKLGKPVAIRTGDSGWTASIGETYLQSLPGAEAVDPGAEAVDPRAVGADPRAVGAETGLALDLGDPRRLTKAVTNWMTRAAEAAEGQEKLLLGAEEAAQVLRTIDPQTVIESILSREWGNWDPVSRWLRGHRDLEDTVSKLLAGEATELIGDAGTEIFEKFREERGQAHPWLNGPPVVRLVGLLYEFTRLHQDLDSQWNILQWSIRGTKLRTDGPWTAEELADAWRDLLETAHKIAKKDMDLPGMEDAVSVDRAPDLERLVRVQATAYFAATGRILDFMRPELEESDGQLLPVDDMRKAASAQRERLVRIVAGARARCRLPMDGVLNCLSKAWQKPDYVVSRSAVGPVDRERIFPKEHSWDEEWYVGPLTSGDDPAPPPGDEREEGLGTVERSDPAP